MKRHFNFVYPGLVFLLVLASLAGGCSTNIPIATRPPLYTQEKVQAVDHWDNIANTVAMRVQKSLEDRKDLINKPLYVQAPSDRPFSLAFYNLLRTRLVSKGMQVSDTREANSLIIEYNVQTVLHESNRSDWMPSLTAMGIGIANLVTGKYTSPSDHEIIINTSMVHNNRYVMHLSTICYINDDEWPMYISPESFDPNAERTRTVPLRAL